MTWRKLGFLHIQILQSTAGPHPGPLYALILDKPASAYRTGFKPHSIAASEQSSSLADSPASSSEPDVEEDSRADSEPAEQSGLDEVSVKIGSDFISAERQTDDLDGQIAKVCISHDGEYATAVCLAAEEPREGDVGGEAAARQP